jgi:Cu+-exporting ATPase
VDHPQNILSGTDAGEAPHLADVELTVDGMHCESCASLIEEVLLEDSSVTSATVDLGAARAVVTYAPATTSVEHLCELVAGVGYQASPVP